MSLAAEWVYATKKALAGWDPAKHPRGRDGRFLEVGDTVAVFSGPESGQIDTGTVIAGHYAPDGRFFIAIESAKDGSTKWYRPKQVEQIEPKAVLPPTGPIPDVGAYGDAATIPWTKNYAIEAAKVQKASLSAVDEKMAAVVKGQPSKAAELVDSLATSSGQNPIDAGFQSAAEIAKHLGAPSAGKVDTWNKPHLSPGTTAATKENALKSPIKVTGTQWNAVWQLIDDQGGPENAGFGFAPNGLDVEVFDFATAHSVLSAAVSQYGGASPVVVDLLATFTKAYKESHPGKPLPGTVFPAGPGGTGYGKLKLDPGEMFIVSQLEEHSADAFGLDMLADTDVISDTAVVTDKNLALTKLADYKSIAADMGIDPSAVDSLMLKVKALPDKPTPTTSPASPPPIKLPKGKSPADLINNIVTSAENKHGAFTKESIKVEMEIGAALSNPDPVMAHKHLAVAMTIAKLGGKQRGRYKQLLDMHLGIQTPVPQKAPAYTAGTVPGDLLPAKPVGLTAAQALGPGAGNAYVNPSTLTPQAAKAAIQQALVARLSDVPTEEFAKIISDSPGMHDGLTAQKLVEAWKTGSYPPGGAILTRSNGTWQFGTSSYAETSLSVTQDNLARAIRETAVNALIGTWAATSNDNNVRSLALQDLAIEEFNLDKDWIYNWHSKPPFMNEHLDAHRATYRRFLREMYNHTQESFAAAGIKYLQLRRGVGSAPTKKDVGTSLKGVGTTGSIIQRPLSSYSSNMSTAQGFGSNVHEAWVPVERIIGSALTGFGCQNEYEYVVLGGSNVVKVLK